MLMELMYLFVRSGCRPSVVASALAFFPPPPSYRLMYDSATGKYGAQMLFEAPKMPRDVTMETHVLETQTRTRIPVFVFRPPAAEATLLYSHGNATDIGEMAIVCALIAQYVRVNVVAYDYTGYGTTSTGLETDDFERSNTTEQQTYSDIVAAYDFCVSSGLTPRPAQQLIVYGQSVGSGPSCYLAARHDKPIAGLVLHSPILSGLRVIMPSRLLALFDIFPNIDRIKSVSVPVFIIHGTTDTVVSPTHGVGLQEAVPSKYQYAPWWVEDRGHNDVLRGNEQQYFAKLEQFVEYVRNFEQYRD